MLVHIIGTLILFCWWAKFKSWYSQCEFSLEDSCCEGQHLFVIQISLPAWILLLINAHFDDVRASSDYRHHRAERSITSGMNRDHFIGKLWNPSHKYTKASVATRVLKIAAKQLHGRLAAFLLLTLRISGIWLARLQSRTHEVLSNYFAAELGFMAFQILLW